VLWLMSVPVASCSLEQFNRNVLSECRQSFEEYEKALIVPVVGRICAICSESIFRVHFSHQGGQASILTSMSMLAVDTSTCQRTTA
jgi:hypothetical protein